MKPNIKAHNNSFTHIGNIGIYISLLLFFIVIFIVGVIIGAKDKEFYRINLVICAITLLVTNIYYFILLYQVWRFAINESQRNGLRPSIKTPARAIGFCFIPLYNLYWIFKAFSKLPKDLNSISKAKNTNKKMSEGIGIAIPILIILSIIPSVYFLTDFINFYPISLIFNITALVNLFILYPVFIYQAIKQCMNIGGIEIITTNKSNAINSYLIILLILTTNIFAVNHNRISENFKLWAEKSIDSDMQIYSYLMTLSMDQSSQVSSNLIFEFFISKKFNYPIIAMDSSYTPTNWQNIDIPIDDYSPENIAFFKSIIAKMNKKRDPIPIKYHDKTIMYVNYNLPKIISSCSGLTYFQIFIVIITLIIVFIFSVFFNRFFIKIKN